jgi:hypothetical protein
MLKTTHSGLCKVISVGNIWDLFVSIPNMHCVPHVDSLGPFPRRNGPNSCYLYL